MVTEHELKKAVEAILMEMGGKLPTPAAAANGNGKKAYAANGGESGFSLARRPLLIPRAR